MGMPNTSNVKTADFPAIKADWYDMVFVDSSEKFDKNKNEYLEIELSFADSDRPAWTNLSYQEDFLWKLKQFKDAISMPGDATDPAPYKGTKLKVFVKNRVFDGSNYPDLKKFKSMDEKASSPPLKPDDDLPF